MRDASTSRAGHRTVRFSSFELDVGTGELRRKGVRISLQEQPRRVLELLLARPKELVTREELRQELWPSNSFVDFDHALNKAINKLREALGDSADHPCFIETLAKRGYRFIGELGIEPGAIRSLLVLPLENLSRDPEQEYFADGLTEALITCLAKIGSLRVTSRTTAMAYKGARKRIPEIARELGVDGIVEGTVMRSEGRVRISAQLLHAPTDTHLWAESYDRDLRDILALHSEVANAIVAEIKAKVSPHEQGEIARVRPIVPEAYEAYLIGRHYWNKRSAEHLRKSAEHFQRAIDSDPTYAAPYAGLAESMTSASFWGFLPSADALVKARAAALKSLELEETGEAHAALGWVTLLYSYDCPASVREFERAIALYPGYASTYSWYGQCVSLMGRVREGVELSGRALKLDPLSMIAYVNHTAITWFARDWDRCVDLCRKALEIDPDFAGLRWMLANVLQSKGDHEQAIQERKRIHELAPDAVIWFAEVGDSYAAAGMRDEARQILQQLIDLRERKYVMAYWIALIHAGLNEKSEAFEWLETARQERAAQLVFVRVDPRWDNLRGDPRFDDLLRRMQPAS